MAKKVLVVALAWMLAIPHGLVAQQPDPELAKGIRQAQTGDFENAILTLDAVAKRLAAQGGRPRELARAYVYLSVAYLGLSQEQKAKARFLEAWKMDKGMELSPKEFPPKALQFFEEARKEAVEVERATARPAPAPTPQTEPRSAAGQSVKKGRSKLPLVLVGLGGATAAGIAIAATGGGDKGTDTRLFCGSYSINTVVILSGPSSCSSQAPVVQLRCNPDLSSFRVLFCNSGTDCGEPGIPGTINSDGTFQGTTGGLSVTGQTTGNQVTFTLTGALCTTRQAGMRV